MSVSGTHFRKRIEEGFEAWTRAVIRHRGLAVLASLLFTGFAVSHLPQLTVDNSIEAMLPAHDPVVVAFNAFRDQFDRDDRVIVAIKTDEVFEPAFLERLRELHRAIEAEVPYVDEVISLLNARNTRGEGDELIVEDLMEVWPETPEAIEALRDRVMNNPLYRNTLISRDGKFTTLTLEPVTYSLIGTRADANVFEGFEDEAGSVAELAPPFLTASESTELMQTLDDVVSRFRGDPDFELYVGGPMALTETINRGMEHDMGIFLPIAVVVIALFLAVLFRRISGVLMPLGIVLLSLVASLGIMIMLGIPGSAVVQILPVFLLTVGVCDAVHILTIVYQQVAEGREKEDAIVFAIGHSGMAVLMTSLTTAAGMASFVTAKLAVIAHLGIIAPIGIMLALIYTLVLLPALLAIIPLRPRPQERLRSPSLTLGRALARVGGVCARNPWTTVALSAVFVAVCLQGASQARFAHNGLIWFPEDDPTRVAFEQIDENLRGIVTMEVLIDTGRPNGLHEPEILGRLEAAAELAESFEQGILYVGKATSIADVVKETHQALNENRAEYRRIPNSRELVAQELLLFENSGTDDLEQLVDSQFQRARLTLRVPWSDAILYGPFLGALERELRVVLGEDVDLEVTGLMSVLAQIFDGVIASMVRSYAFALIVITPMMMLLLGSVRRGLLSMIPNLIPVVFVLGMMGWLGINLDATTVLVGAMVIGLAVDDTIHFMHRFQRYFEEHGDAYVAVDQTLKTTGAALLFTSLVLSAGFVTFTGASMSNTRAFGGLASSACLVALAADVMLAPALMVLVSRWKAPVGDSSKLNEPPHAGMIDPKTGAA